MKIINGKLIFDKTYIIAELSCNHLGKIENALKLVEKAKECGADAVKLQTYTGDTITLNCDNEHFKVKGTSWDNMNTLWNLFESAHTPWEWHKIIQEKAHSLGLDFFSAPFDTTAVDFLESLKVPLYKIASMEITDHVLIKKVAETKKPVIISTGMASITEINDAINILKENDCPYYALLKCTSAYPARYEDANLKTLKNMKETFNCDVGLSDHTLGITVPIVSVALGASIIEKHFTLDRADGGPDSEFSLEPSEFKEMVNSVRIAEKSIGEIKYGGVKNEVRLFRRSLFITEDIKKGDKFIFGKNFRSVRPGNGLHTKYTDFINNKFSNTNLQKGTPLELSFIDNN